MPRIKRVIMSTEIEKKNLEAHVELCAERYETLAERYIALQTRIDVLGSKVSTLETHIVFIREAIAGAAGKQNKQLITIGTAVMTVLISGMISLLINFINKS
jgi:predicted  nucleic acid-binding Zn-ribbon protein